MEWSCGRILRLKWLTHVLELFNVQMRTQMSFIAQLLEIEDNLSSINFIACPFNLIIHVRAHYRGCNILFVEQ